MAETKNQFDTFKEAFCAAHRCRPERFERKVFWRCAYRSSMPLTCVMWLLERSMFQTDFEVIRAIGAAGSETELQTLVDEFENLRNVERSIRRGLFRMRVNGTRLAAVFQELLPLMKPPVAVLETAVKTQPAPPAGGPRDAREGGAMMVRRLKRFHAEVVSGHPLADAIAEAGLEPREVPELLAQHKEGRAELAWLQDYLLQQERFTALEAENMRLTKLTADLTAKLFSSPGPT